MRKILCIIVSQSGLCVLLNANCRMILLAKSVLSLAGIAIVALLQPVCADEVEPPRHAAKSQPASERWRDLSKADSASFRRHVIPLMARAGCSGRECHGSFSGQGGFQLSLFGYDFDKDHSEITKDEEDGPRIDPTHPMKSLILTKPTLDGGETHKGKKRFEKGSWEYNMILKWITDGAKMDVVETGEFDRLEVLPRELLFKKVGDKVQLKVIAHWKDGTVEDVTQITRFRTNDESVADVSDTGLVTCKERGDTHVVAFYDNGVHPVPALLPVGDPAKYPKIAARTKVDELVLAKLRKVGVIPSEVCDDDDFLRRASLDVTGTLPTPEEITAFLANKAPDKRPKKIEELLARPGYSAWWATKMSDFTGNNPRQIRNVLQGGGRNLNTEISRQWYEWLRKRIEDNTPYDQIAAGIVMATSRTASEQSFEEMAREMSAYFRKDNPADFAARPNMPWFWARNNVQKSEDKALAFAHTFLGVRIECAQCHKHPFDQWTKTDFEQFQAFFAPLVVSARGSKNDPPGVMSAFSLKAEIDAKVKELADKAMAEAKMKAETDAAEGDAGEKSPEQKKREAQELAKLRQEQQKRGQSETDRRLAAGEPVPWTELHVDLKRTVTRQDDRKKKDVRGSSRVITPKLLGGDEVMLATYNDPRQPLMDWLKAKENPYFAKAFVNRVWAGYFHRGIVEPADDLNLANAPTNEELFDYLTAGFVGRGYDIKWLHREILNSDTYQRSWQTNATNKLDEKNFSRAVIRRLPAELVFDALNMATASTEKMERFPVNIAQRSIGAAGNTAQPGGGGNKSEGYALSIFGKPARETNCDCERVTDPTLLQTLFTRNDQTVLGMIDDGSGWIGELRKLNDRNKGDNSPEALRKKLAIGREKIAGLKAPEKPAADAEPEKLADYERDLRRHEERTKEYSARISEMERALAEAEKPAPTLDVERAVRMVFLRTVSRPPTASELQQAKKDVAAESDAVTGIRNLLWAMLNTREFLVNR
jgi:Protein of unknown function (DUF1549)/Protein of unknown function (DUF1553)